MNFKLSKFSHYKLNRLFSLNTCGNQKQNHYDCLGVTPKATQGDIKNAYYKLSKQFHPDVNKDNPSAAEKFRDITAAYEILGNLKNRKLYDRGIVVGSRGEDHSESTEQTKENLKHASFYHHRNKPPSRKTVTEKTPMYNLDEWTKAHYSETFSNSFQKKQGGYAFVKDKLHTKGETDTFIQVFSILIMTVAVVMVYEVNAYKKFDQPSEKVHVDKEPD